MIVVSWEGAQGGKIRIDGNPAAKVRLRVISVYM